MNESERDHILYLEDIVLSMQRVQEYVIGMDFIRFQQDHKTVDAVIRNFEIIGEAAKNIPLSVKEKYPQIPWKGMYRLRNKISHEYFGIDYEIIWDIVTRQMPQDFSDLSQILATERMNKK